jgi:hypothetical protein
MANDAGGVPHYADDQWSCGDIAVRNKDRSILWRLDPQLPVWIPDFPDEVPER